MLLVRVAISVILLLLAIIAGAFGVHFQASSTPAFVIAGTLLTGFAGNILYAGFIALKKPADSVAHETTHTLLRQLLANLPQQATPQIEKQLGGALASIQEAAGTDNRLAMALTLLRQNKIAEAETLLRQFAEEKTARIATDRKEAATAYRNLGAIAVLRNQAAAYDAYRKALENDPDDIDSKLWLGYVEINRGHLQAAEGYFNAMLQPAQRSAPDIHAIWVSFGLGDVRHRMGSLTAALASYRAGQSTAQTLAQADPHNTQWQRALSISHERIGDILEAEGNLTQALASQQEALGIRQTLSQADPHNTEWQRDLSVSHNKIGSTLRAQGNLTQALASYQEALGIAQALSQADPHNTQWQRDLSVSHNRIGDILRMQGNLTQALACYQEALGIAQTLAQADPHNTEWQRDLAMSYAKFAQTHETEGNKPEALKYFRQGQAMMQRLHALDETNAQWKQDLDNFNNCIAGLS